MTVRKYPRDMYCRRNQFVFISKSGFLKAKPMQHYLRAIKLAALRCTIAPDTVPYAKQYNQVSGSTDKSMELMQGTHRIVRYANYEPVKAFVGRFGDP
ncbi:hypothetical protein GWI33_008621 [Rhynchophorus ferrugineus]|uniref:Uncharacterized protein n=1 Tax=Rhynchophorus ferrugineus TaxID=354439 RepID=A0A834MFT8_RHYFE|nr:hypothetical protein GWI33_008621 [Rhynchophorus ferrugineus]